MRQHPRHRARSVMFRQSISAHDVGKPLIRGARVLVLWPLFVPCCRVALLLGIEWIPDRRLQGLIVGWKRAVCQSLRNPDPADAIRVQDEGFIAREGLISLRIFMRLVIGRFAFREVRDIQARPLFLLLIPPNQFLSFAPWTAIGARRSAVIKDATIGGPGKTPAMSQKIPGATLIGAVFAWAREYARVDPAA